jgi:hypothetical protein
MRQIKELKRRTADFGVPYIELTFGKLLGKGSQGEVFKAVWRYSTPSLSSPHHITVCMYVCMYRGQW